MSWSHALWAHVGTGLAVAALLLWRSRFRSLSPWVGGLVLLLLFGLTYLPVANIDLGGYVYAITGPLSLTSLVLLAGVTTRRLWGVDPLSRAERDMLLHGIAVIAICFYPLALGLTPFDPYALGFGDWGMQLVVCAAGLLAWGLGYRALGLLLLAVIWVFQLRLGESDNLWDYLLDAWLALYALLMVSVSGARRMLAMARKRRAAG